MDVICMYACYGSIHVGMYIGMYVYAYISVCIYGFMYVCRQACIYACMYIYTHYYPANLWDDTYTSDTGACQYSTMYGSVKSSSFKDICLHQCLVFMCTNYNPLQIWIQYSSSKYRSLVRLYSHIFELCDCWIWSVQWTLFCNGVVSLLCADYIRAENAWVSQIWQNYGKVP